MAISDLLLT